MSLASNCDVDCKVFSSEQPKAIVDGWLEQQHPKWKVNYGMMIREPMDIVLSGVMHKVARKRIASISAGFEDIRQAQLAGSIDGLSTMLSLAFHAQLSMLSTVKSAKRRGNVTMSNVNIADSMNQLSSLFFVGLSDAYLESKYLLMYQLGSFDRASAGLRLQLKFRRECEVQLAVTKCHDTGDCDAMNAFTKGGGDSTHHLRTKNVRLKLSVQDLRTLTTVTQQDAGLWRAAANLFFDRLSVAEEAVGLSFRCSSLAQNWNAFLKDSVASRMKPAVVVLKGFSESFA
jgi:hypothetical protein